MALSHKSLVMASAHAALVLHCSLNLADLGPRTHSQSPDQALLTERELAVDA
jgi:hypothetical protein